MITLYSHNLNSNVIQMINWVDSRKEFLLTILVRNYLFIYFLKLHWLIRMGFLIDKIYINHFSLARLVHRLRTIHVIACIHTFNSPNDNLFLIRCRAESCKSFEIRFHDLKLPTDLLRMSCVVSRKINLP